MVPRFMDYEAELQSQRCDFGQGLLAIAFMMHCTMERMP
jgi:hypothetical protein